MEEIHVEERRVQSQLTEEGWVVISDETTTKTITVERGIPRFDIGQLAVTQGATDLLEAYGKHPYHVLFRHQSGDWGDLDEADKAENELSLEQGFRLFSSYKLSEEDKVWVITEADRSYTTILLPSEY